MMRILTMIRQVLDAEETVRLRNGAVDLEGSKLVMDTMDEYGVEEALRMREAGRRRRLRCGSGAGSERGGTADGVGDGCGPRDSCADRCFSDAIALSKVMAQIAKRKGRS